MGKCFGAVALLTFMALVGCNDAGNKAVQAPTTSKSTAVAKTGDLAPPPAPGGPGGRGGPGRGRGKGRGGEKGRGDQPAPAETPPAAVSAAAGMLTPENMKIEFVGTKKDGKHLGGFKKLKGSVKPTTGDFAASHIELEIDTQSLFTDTEPKLTAHLKSPDFFDVQKHPTATFVSTAIKPSKEGETTHQITGDLTLHGNKKPITIPVKVTQTDDAWTMEGQFTLNRLDYGIAFRPDMVNKDVTVKVSAKIARK
jgi:polyisoprenoid-binding protein YceI